MRIAGRGLVDPDQRLSFTFDGQEVQALAGDTVASALLANDIRLVGRSFKYHRPRGIWSAGPEEPNALVTLHEGARQTPNQRATVQEVFDGLKVSSQNRWPSLKTDMLSVNDLFAPFLGAGFYYKTFMWPRAFWEKIYEPVIRRAAGLGALSGYADPETYDKAFAHCDILVIGAGPTGLVAALAAGRAGADVILAEQDARAGGRLLAEVEEVAGQPGPSWVEEVLAELGAMPNVRVMTRMTVTGVYDQGTFGALERNTMHLADPGDAPRQTFWRIAAKASVLASGGIERGIAFEDNDRPGVMAASAVRAYANRWGVAPGKSVALFANNDDAHRTARDLIEAGVSIAAVVDTRDEVEALADYPLYAGAVVTGTRGRLGLTDIAIREASGNERTIWADTLAVSGGWNPSVHLTCHMNGRPVWDEGLAAFVPAEGAVPGMFPAGGAAGAQTTTACLAAGLQAAGSALAELGLDTPKVELPEAENGFTGHVAFWAVEGKGRAWLDLANDVTVKDVKLSAQENFASVEHMKRYTTQGMAPDQGKNSNVAALAILADATGRTIPQTGTTTFRPPFAPVPISAMGAGATGKGFAPERFTTSHGPTEELRAPFVEAGLWYRPSYFPKAGETTWRQSCDREVRMVREAVGVADVSTLGKIDIQGPDAAALLDFVYTNTFSTLKVGKVRYGLMLREDGHVMDDGTTARLGEMHYVMTTTTAAAGQVMQHLDFVLQALKPEWDVKIASVTEQWAQFAVAGPKARQLLETVLDGSIDWADWPFMSCGPASVAGVPGRLFRISFSGEEGFEVAVPARYGEALFRLLLGQAAVLGGGPYGMEALNVLRIEKGFITHSEIHGRVTAFDVGMERMISAKKDCIGKTMAARPGLNDPERERLVGLKPVGSVKQLTAGAHLFNRGASAVRTEDQGYVTSVGWSPTLESYLGLAFLKRGPERHGEVIRMVDHLRNVETEVEVCDPVFFDPKGGRMRG